MVKVFMIMTLASFLLLLLAVGVAANNSNDNKRRVRIKNHSGSSLEIFWIHPETNDFVLVTKNVSNGSTQPLDSFVDHEFEIHELPSSDSGFCDTSDELTCRRVKFHVSDAKKQVLTVEKDFSTRLSSKRIRAPNEDLIQWCLNEFGFADDTLMKNASNNHSTAEEISKRMHQYEECVQDGVLTTLEQFEEKIKFAEKLRKEMGRKLEQFRCHDNDLETTEPFATEVWVSPRDGELPRKAHILHRRTASEIHVIEDFISPVECAAIDARARKRGLKNATVADGQGGKKQDPGRKALQAGIKVNYENENASGNLIPKLSRRVFDYVNHVLDLNIQEFGQESLISIQYFGRGTNDTQPDNYKPHCDGDCSGQPHKYGSRMATMVMYCTVPESGGHTNFRNAGVHIKPEVGNAIFFSYINPETKLMDTGFTEHSGCPVYVGEKKIVTQWIRYGVDVENPWNSFDTLDVQNKNKTQNARFKGMDGQDFCPIGGS